ncbi:MAG TPA: sigma-54 dependent transcriptional regulator [Polyangiaceae bacterium]|nr:sigma-54 dependent transcriptional regulator [Polyangiaceae bacterium]
MVSRRPVDVVFEPAMRSSSMRDLDRIIRAIAPKDVGVTLIGESGTGKEILARRIHELSPRRAGPFMPINCAAIPDTLFESELFGHERGAFTGANERARGKLEASGGGTLFLDEIGEMPLIAQAKLLRFLESRKFMRVGGHTKIQVDARLVCATLRPLEQEVKAGRFRADLYYRIQGVTLHVPPLRERPADVAPLVGQFVAELSARHGVKPPRIGRAAMNVLRRYEWPGNVRELKNVIELLCLLRAGKRVGPADLPAPLAALGEHPRDSPEETSLTVSLTQPLDAIVRAVFEAALRLEGGNRSRTARRLGVSLRTVQRQLGGGRRR